jgi:ribosomal protein S18 acetylase RimI-like enzyme
MSFVLRSLTSTDVRSAKDIFQQAFPVTKTLEFSKAWKERVTDSSLGAYTKEGDLVGFVLCDVGGYKYRGTKIQFIAVHPMFQGKGVGDLLLNEVILLETEEHRTILLTPVLNDKVWYWYHKRDFYVTKTSPAVGGGTFYLMTRHSYPTRSKGCYARFQIPRDTRKS